MKHKKIKRSLVFALCVHDCVLEAPFEHHWQLSLSRDGGWQFQEPGHWHFMSKRGHSCLRKSGLQVRKKKFQPLIPQKGGCEEKPWRDIIIWSEDGTPYLWCTMSILGGRFGFPDNNCLGYLHVRMLLLGLLYCYSQSLQGKKCGAKWITGKNVELLCRFFYFCTALVAGSWLNCNQKQPNCNSG